MFGGLEPEVAYGNADSRGVAESNLAVGRGLRIESLVVETEIAPALQQALGEVFQKRKPTYIDGTPTTTIGPPTSGARVLSEFWPDGLLGEWVCTAAGTPGTWMQIRPAPVTSDPASGTIPTGYLIFNVTTGHIKRHAGGYVWEVPEVWVARSGLWLAPIDLAIRSALTYRG